MQAVRFVDNGFPEAHEYASNYHTQALRHKDTMRPRTLHATLRLLRRTLRKLTATSGPRGNQSAGTRTPATLAQRS